MNIRHSRNPLLGLFTALLLATGISGTAHAAATAEELSKDGEQALEALYKSNPSALKLSKEAKAVLVFPKIVKAGLVFGGSYGEGVLTKGKASSSYYNSISASWGLQAGAQTYGYALFLMSDAALEYLDKSSGWELGTGPAVVLVNEGVAKNLTTSTLRKDAYAYVFDQQGLMAALSIEGTKISPIKR